MHTLGADRVGGQVVGVVVAVAAIVLLTVFASSLAGHVVEAIALSFGGFLALLVTAVGKFGVARAELGVSPDPQVAMLASLRSVHQADN